VGLADRLLSVPTGPKPQAPLDWVRDLSLATGALPRLTSTSTRPPPRPLDAAAPGPPGRVGYPADNRPGLGARVLEGKG